MVNISHPYHFTNMYNTTITTAKETFAEHSIKKNITDDFFYLYIFLYIFFFDSYRRWKREFVNITTIALILFTK